MQSWYQLSFLPADETHPLTSRSSATQQSLPDPRISEVPFPDSAKLLGDSWTRKLVSHEIKTWDRTMGGGRMQAEPSLALLSNTVPFFFTLLY